MKEQIKVMISEAEVDNRISEMAAAIDKAYAGKTVHLIGVYYPFSSATHI